MQAPGYNQAPPGQTMVQNVTQMPPQPQSMVGADPTKGLGFMSTYDGLFIQQKIEVFEAISGCDTKNRYHITPIPQGMPDPAPPEWVKNFKETAAAAPMLKAKEESECMERICCPQFRSFTMPFMDGAGVAFFTLQRPYHCSINTPCCNLCPQEINLNDASGAPAAHAIEDFKMCWCCTRVFSANDEMKVPQYKVHAGECSSSRGCNICAPSCFNESYDMDIYDAAETKVIGVMSSIFPGCNCGGLTERSNLILRFPAEATPKQRASLVAALMLIEFAHFEWKRQENKNSGG